MSRHILQAYAEDIRIRRQDKKTLAGTMPPSRRVAHVNIGTRVGARIGLKCDAGAEWNAVILYRSARLDCGAV